MGKNSSFREKLRTLIQVVKTGGSYDVSKAKKKIYELMHRKKEEGERKIFLEEFVREMKRINEIKNVDMSGKIIKRIRIMAGKEYSFFVPHAKEVLELIKKFIREDL